MLTIGDGCGLRVGGRIGCCIVCVGSGLGVMGLTSVAGLTFELSGVDPIGGLLEWWKRVIFVCCGEGGRRRLNSCRRNVISSLCWDSLVFK